MSEIGAKIRNPHTDWEWRAYKGGETARYCADCGEQFTPRARVQKYCLKCKPNHRGWKHYETIGVTKR